MREHYVAIGTSGGGTVRRTIGAWSAVGVMGQDPSCGDALWYEVDDYT